MKPQINSPAGVQAINILKNLMPYCPPDVMSFGYTELMNAYLQGRVATMISGRTSGKRPMTPSSPRLSFSTTPVFRRCPA